MGRVRAAISGVTVCKGEANTTSAHSKTASTVPTASERAASLSQETSPMASAKPSPIIGPISGDSSMAPITTAGDDSNRPSTAMPADMASMKR